MLSPFPCASLPRFYLSHAYFGRNPFSGSNTCCYKQHYAVQCFLEDSLFSFPSRFLSLKELCCEMSFSERT